MPFQYCSCTCMLNEYHIFEVHFIVSELVVGSGGLTPLIAIAISQWNCPSNWFFISVQKCFHSGTFLYVFKCCELTEEYLFMFHNIEMGAPCQQFQKTGISDPKQSTETYLIWIEAGIIKLTPWVILCKFALMALFTFKVSNFLFRKGILCTIIYAA